MKKDDKIYVKHILECITNIELYTQGDKPRFISDVMLRDACLRQLQIMAESTTRLSSESKNKVENVPWSQIAGFRNIIAHDYLGDIDFETVWTVIENRLPELKNALSKTLTGL